MRKKLLIAIISAIVIIALIIIFFPKSECGSWSSMGPTETKCSCIGIKTHPWSPILGGETLFSCKGICLKNTCVKITPEVITADASDPLQFETKELQVNKGDTTPLKIAVYNDGRFGDAKVKLLLQQCVSEAGENITGINLLAPEQVIHKGTVSGWRVLINVNQTVDEGKYLCEVRASDGTNFLSNQLFIIVI